MSNKTEIIELLEEANDLVYQAVDALTRAKDLMKDESYGYNVTGNMEGYVTGYLTEGVDCISDKIEKYIEETRELEEIQEDDEEDDNVNDLERDAFFDDAEEQQRRDEKNGLYPSKWDDAN